jgi:hypothetical protein
LVFILGSLRKMNITPMRLGSVICLVCDISQEERWIEIAEEL